VTRIVVTGATGQVGWEVTRSLLPLGEVLTPSRIALDLCDPAAVRQYLRALAPSVIINAAAYTAVDRAESDEDRAMAINGTAPGVIADEAKRCGALMVHYSTDYVFDGAKAGAYSENDHANPQNAYGTTKLAGEQAVRQSGADHLVFRTSWVYGARGSNFLRTILRLAREREQLRIVADQIGAPTWSRLIAEATALALKQAMAERREQAFKSGLYHLTACGETSWYGFAKYIVELAATMPGIGPLRVNQVEAISSAEFPLPARRPANSCLSSETFMRRFDIELPTWERCTKLVLDELANAAS
jgi:dTDP-4-dehydrorhamnose reductase